AYACAAVYRFALIYERLHEKKQFDLEDLEKIQHDSTSIPGRTLARLLQNTVVTEPALAPYVKLFTDWDGVLSPESRAGPLYAVWVRELQDAFYGRHVPKELLDGVRSLSGLPALLA